MSVDESEKLSPEFTGVSPPCTTPDEPFAALDNLMFVVEGLCPVWPPKPIDGTGGCYKL